MTHLTEECRNLVKKETSLNDMSQDAMTLVCTDFIEDLIIESIQNTPKNRIIDKKAAISILNNRGLKEIGKQASQYYDELASELKNKKILNLQRNGYNASTTNAEFMQNLYDSKHAIFVPTGDEPARPIESSSDDPDNYF